ncbi:hypothetical protein CMUS01_10479 [Colletotrichum musicola]|uniref:Uncharacterized protein n=1 Tax=Colletotrichum musicola TaxID=2175873 RepID=A0A8H6N866_9PEZI|nr:hypothetical protein CMUS01_10479 [Colletotrichum musicola]
MAGLKSSPDSSNTSPSIHALFSRSLVPRFLTRVPKDQQTLLDNSDSWVSGPKAGRNGGGNVPPKVLEQVKYFHTAHTLPPPAQKPQEPISSAPSPTAPRQIRSLNDEAEEGDNISESSSETPGTPISWSSSPKRPSPSAVQDRSSSPSIKSQVDLESQVPVSSAPSGLPSSPPMAPLPGSPVRKRPNPPARFPQPDFKRRRIGPFPSSSAGLEDDLETAIPGAVDQATPPINKVAARQATVSQAVTSPPCGQDSMVPSTYDDARGAVMAPAQNKRRRYKAIKFSPEPAEDRPSSTDSPRLTTIPFSQPSGARPPQSSDSSRPPLLTASGEVLSPTSQVVQETPSAPRCFGESRRADESPKIENVPKLASVTGLQGEDAAKSKVVIDLVDELPASDRGGLSKDELQRRQLIRQLDVKWKAERSEWLPPDLRHLRSTLSCRSLETLYSLTKTAVVAGIKLERLWAEPDGCLYIAKANRSSGNLSFPENLIHQTQNFFQAETSRLAKEQSTAIGLAAADVSPRVPPTAGPAENQTSITAGATQVDRPNSVTGPPSDRTTKTLAERPSEAFRAAYPSYRGSVGDFVKACLVVKRLHRKQALPKWLYDDFIRAFAEGYIPYVEKKDTTDGTPLSAIQWYVENVEQPTFHKGVVTVGNLDLVFEKYAHEFKSARQSLGGDPSSLPSSGIEQTSGIEQEGSPLETAPEVETARESTRVELLPEAVEISKAAVAHVPSEEAAPPSRTVAEDTPDKPRKAPTAQEKGKQRMSVGGPSDRPAAPAPKPALNTPQAAAPDDEDMIFVSSTTRPLSAPSKTGSVHTVKREGHSSSHALGQNMPRRSLNERDGAFPQKGRVGSVVETPPARSAAPPGSSLSNEISRPAATPGRSRVDFGPPSFQSSSPTLNSLSASTTDSRSKKPKADSNKADWEKRWERKMKKKLEKKRLYGPGSTPQKAEDGGL